MPSPIITPDTAAADEADLFEAFREGVSLSQEIQNLRQISDTREATIVESLKSQGITLESKWIDEHIAPLIGNDAATIMAERAVGLGAKERLTAMTQKASEIFVDRSVLLTPVDKEDEPFDRYIKGDIGSVREFGSKPNKAKGSITGVFLTRGVLMVKPQLWTRESLASMSYRHVGAHMLKEDGQRRVHVEFID